jgi:hypothetical protein
MNSKGNTMATMDGEVMTKDKALDLALEALESATPKYTRQRKDQRTLGGTLDYWKLEQHQRLKAITAIKQARSAPVQEHGLKDVRCECCGYLTYQREHMGCIRATAAAQRQWVGLTDEEILKLAYPIRWQEVDDFEADKAVNFAQMVEAKLKEKNSD